MSPPPHPSRADRSGPLPSHRAPALQAALHAARQLPRAPHLLPASTKLNGRFVIDKALFPAHIDRLTLSDFLSWRWKMRGKSAPVPSQAELDALLPVVKPAMDRLAEPEPEKAQVTWLGHACCLVQWEGWSVLCDPVFSERCAPVQWAGPKRVRESPLDVGELPEVDAVVISHSHYDHLDRRSVEEISRAQPVATFFVPLGMKTWFGSVLGEDVADRSVVEMDWGEEAILRDEDIAHPTHPATASPTPAPTVHTPPSPRRPPLTLVCVPCQHWCRRTPFDTNAALWSSWIAKTASLTYFFGGDTGYCGDVFRRVGELYPVDLAAIPIGAYGVPEERWFHEPNHMDPGEAVDCHVDLRSRQSVGVHWGTFLLTGEHVMEPPKKLEEAMREKRLENDAFVVLGHGETRVFDLVRSGPRMPEGETLMRKGSGIQEI